MSDWRSRSKYCALENSIALAIKHQIEEEQYDDMRLIEKTHRECEQLQNQITKKIKKAYTTVTKLDDRIPLDKVELCRLKNMLNDIKKRFDEVSLDKENWFDDWVDKYTQILKNLIELVQMLEDLQDDNEDYQCFGYWLLSLIL